MKSTTVEASGQDAGALFLRPPPILISAGILRICVIPRIFVGVGMIVEPQE